mmetsp:Transcript_113473/g.197079  ORF Transcript_113473/g.197079 Transcript_113473/m.197079 type:complete len:113 (-) Transcript_113473:522-860(-)
MRLQPILSRPVVPPSSQLQIAVVVVVAQGAAVRDCTASMLPGGVMELPRPLYTFLAGIPDHTQSVLYSQSGHGRGHQDWPGTPPHPLSRDPLNSLYSITRQFLHRIFSKSST